MASAWGKSWGKSWGNSWGLLTPTVQTRLITGGGGPEPWTLQQKIQKDDEICLQSILSCAIILLNSSYGGNRVIRSKMQMRETPR